MRKVGLGILEEMQDAWVPFLRGGIEVERDTVDVNTSVHQARVRPVGSGVSLVCVCFGR